MRLALSGVSVRLGVRTVVSDVDLAVGEGELVGLVGPNGSGKSTLLRTVYRAVRPSAGTVRIDGDDVARMRQREVARRVAVVTQDGAVDADFTVGDLVMTGRTPHRGALDRDTPGDRGIVAAALATVDASHLAHRAVTTLSGGERQRVLLARALAQRVPLLLLDEPTNHLDIRAAHDLLALVSDLGLATLCVLHDLNLAAGYCDRVAVLDAGRLVADGTPADVLTAALVGDVFAVTTEVLVHPATARPLLAFGP